MGTPRFSILSIVGLLLFFITTPTPTLSEEATPECSATGMKVCFDIREAEKETRYIWRHDPTNPLPELCVAETTIANGKLQKCITAPFSAEVDGALVTNPCRAEISQDTGKNKIITVAATAVVDGILFGAVQAREISSTCYYLGEYEKELKVVLENEVEIILNELPGNPQNSFDFDDYKCEDSVGNAEMDCRGVLTDGNLKMTKCEQSIFTLPGEATREYQNFSIIIAAEVTFLKESSAQSLLYFQPADPARASEALNLLEVVKPAANDVRCPEERTATTICAGGADVSQPIALYLTFNSVDGMKVYSGPNSDLTWSDATITPKMLGGDFIYLKNYNLASGCSNLDTTAPNVLFISPARDETDVDLDSDVIIAFDEPVRDNGGTFILTQSATGDSEMVTIRQDMISQGTLTIPLKQLKGGIQYEARLFGGSVADASGNAAAEVSWSFTTATGTPDETGPSVVSGHLQEGETATPGWPAQPIYVVEFDEPIKGGQGSLLFEFTPTGDATTRNPVAFDIEESLKNGDMTIVGEYLIVHPTEAFPKDNTVSVTIPQGIVEDLSGNPNEDREMGGYIISPEYTTGVCPGESTNAQCGPDGISEEECVSRSCCWDGTCKYSNVVQESDFTLTRTIPEDESMNVSIPLSALFMRFSKDISVHPSAGDIFLRPISADAATRISLRVDTRDHTVYGKEVRFSLPHGHAVEPGGWYEVQVPYGLIHSLTNEYFDGTTLNWKFFIPAHSDTTAPKPLPHLAIPKTRSTEVPTSADIALPYDENIALGQGNIIISSTSFSSSFQEVINIMDSRQIQIRDNIVFISPRNHLPQNEEIQIIAPAGTVIDMRGNPSVSLGPGKFTFTTTSKPSQVALQAIAYSPLPGSTEVALARSFSIQFDQPIKLLSGQITITPTDATSLAKGLHINVRDDPSDNSNDDGACEVFGDVLHISLSTPLSPSTLYQIQIPGVAITTLDEGLFDGIPERTWSFTTTTVFSPQEAAFSEFFTSPRDQEVASYDVRRVGIFFDRDIAITRPRSPSRGVSIDSNVIVSITSPTADPWTSALQDCDITDRSVSFVPNPPLLPDTVYTVSLSAGALTAAKTPTSPATLSAAITFTFTTGPKTDNIPPVPDKNYNPELNDVVRDIPSDAPLFVAFPEHVYFEKGESGWFLYDVGDGSIRNVTLAASEEEIDVLGSVIVYTPKNQPILDENNAVIMTVPEGTFRDAAGNTNAVSEQNYFLSRGLIQEPGEGNPSQDFEEPGIVRVNGEAMVIPPANYRQTPSDVTLAMMFTERVQVASGLLLVASETGNHIVQVELSDASRVKTTTNNLAVLIELPELLRSSTTYQVIVPQGAIRDYAGRSFAGTSGGASTFKWEFRTGDNLGPPQRSVDTVETIQVSDDNRSVGVQFNQDVTLLSEGIVQLVPVDSTTDGQNVDKYDAITIPFPSDEIEVVGTSILLTPAETLLPNTNYKVVFPQGVLRGSTGAANEILAKDFATGDNSAGLPDVAPANDLDAVFPRTGSTDVEPGTSLVLRFNQPIHLGPQAKLFFRSDDGSSIPPISLNDPEQVSLRSDTLYISPSLHFPPSAEIRMFFSSGGIMGAETGVLDPDSANIKDATSDPAVDVPLSSWSFTTKAEADLTGFSIDSIQRGFYPDVPADPPLDGKNRFPDQPFCLLPPSFNGDSDKVHHISLGAAPRPVTITCDQDYVQTFPSTQDYVDVVGDFVRVCPPQRLPRKRSCTLSIEADTVQDEARNGNTAYSMDFKTPDIRDVTPPSLVLNRVNPASGSTDYPADTHILLEFDEPLLLNPNLDPYVFLNVEGETDPIRLKVSPEDINDGSVILRPGANLPVGKRIDVRVPAGLLQDFVGNEIEEASWVFTAAAVDTEVPPIRVVRVLLHNAPSGAGDSLATTNRGVAVILSAPAADIPNNWLDFNGKDSGTATPLFQDHDFIAHYENRDRILKVDLPPLHSDEDTTTEYTVSLPANNVQNRNGDSLASEYTWSFRTRQGPTRLTLVRPTIDALRLLPAQGATNVAEDGSLIITLDQPVSVGPRQDATFTTTKVRFHPKSVDATDTSQDVVISLHDTSACTYGTPSTLVICSYSGLQYSTEYSVIVEENAFTGLKTKGPSQAFSQTWDFTTRPQPPVPGSTNDEGSGVNFDGFHFYDDTLSADELPDAELLFVESRGKFTLRLDFCTAERCGEGRKEAPYQYPTSARKYFFGASVTARSYYPVFRSCKAVPEDFSVVPQEQELPLAETFCPMDPNRAAWNQEVFEKNAFAETHSFAFAGFTTVYLTCDVSVLLKEYDFDTQCPVPARRVLIGEGSPFAPSAFRSPAVGTFRGRRRLQTTDSTGSDDIQRTLRMGPFFPGAFGAVVLPLGAPLADGAAVGAVVAPVGAGEAAADEGAFWWWWILLIALLLLLLLLLLLCLFCCYCRKRKKEVAEPESKEAIKAAFVAQATMDAYDEGNGEEEEEEKTRRATLAKQAEQQQTMDDGYSEGGDDDDMILGHADAHHAVPKFGVAAGAGGSKKRNSLDEVSTGTPVQGLFLDDHWGDRRGKDGERRQTQENYFMRGVDQFYDEMQMGDHIPDSEGVASQAASQRAHDAFGDAQ